MNAPASRKISSLLVILADIFGWSTHPGCVRSNGGSTQLRTIQGMAIRTRNNRVSGFRSAASREAGFNEVRSFSAATALMHALRLTALSLQMFGSSDGYSGSGAVESVLKGGMY